MSNTLYVFFGMTGAGKSSIIDLLTLICPKERILTTTTRPRRDVNDNEYNFVTTEEFLADQSKYISVRKYNAILEKKPKDYYYAVNSELIKNGGLLITDFEGYKELATTRENVVGIYIHVDAETRFQRAQKRSGFKLDEYKRRDSDDLVKFKLENIIAFGTEHPLYIVNNNSENSILSVVMKVGDIIEEHEKRAV